MLGEEIPGPGEGVGYGLVPGQEDGEDFVADLFVGHTLQRGTRYLVRGTRLFRFVGAGEEHGEEVSFIWLSRICCDAVLGDEVVDDVVEASLGAAELHDAGDG